MLSKNLTKHKQYSTGISNDVGKTISIGETSEQDTKNRAYMRNQERSLTTAIKMACLPRALTSNTLKGNGSMIEALLNDFDQKKIIRSVEAKVIDIKVASWSDTTLSLGISYHEEIVVVHSLNTLLGNMQL